MGKIINGVPFEHPLTALWAAFLSAIEVPWKWWDLFPDRDCFFLPTLGCFLLVDAHPFPDTLLDVIKAGRDRGSCALVAFWGEPGVHQGYLSCYDLTDSSGGASDWRCWLCNDSSGALSFGIVDGRSDRTWFADELFTNALPVYAQPNAAEAFFPIVRVEVALDEAKAMVRKAATVNTAYCRAWRDAMVAMQKQRLRRLKGRGMVKLYKEGDQFAIVTDCQDEHEFAQEFSEALGILIGRGAFISVMENGDIASDWEFQLNGWLPQFVDICCKYRGYKSEVKERKQYMAGSLDPGSDAIVATGGKRTPTVHPKPPHFTNGDATLEK